MTQTSRRAGLRALLLAACCTVTPAAMTAAVAAGEPYQLQVSSNPSAMQATLRWASDAAGVTAFTIERRVVGSRVWTALAQVPAAQRLYLDSGLAPQRGYEYRVRAFFMGGAAAGLVSLDSAVLVTPGASAIQSDYDAAATPRNVDAQAVSGSEIIVTWTDVTPDESNFKVERRQGSGPWSAVALPAADSTLYRDTGLAAGASYEYRVSAERAGLLAVPSAGKLAGTPAVAMLLRHVDGCVDNTGSNSGTQANPWRTPQTAAFTNLAPGTTVLVRNRADCPQPTVYRTVANATTGAHNFAVLAIGNEAAQGQFATGGARSGVAGAPITFRNYPGERPKIRTTRGGVNPTTGAATSGNFHGISVRNASHIVVQGFEIEGHLNDVSLQEAADLNAFYKANRSASITSVLDSNGISVGNSNQQAALARELPHNVVVRDNIIYNVTGGGINALFADRVTIENNRVSNVSAYSPFGASAINIYRVKDVDNDTSSYKIVVRNNVASEAKNLFPCGCFNYVQPTDGNGFIVDQNNNNFVQTTTAPVGANPPIPPGTYTLPPYAGRILIANNISTNNGARGIHVLNSANVDIVFNTVVNNSQIQITGDGEITSQNARNVRVYDNIIVARSDRPTHWISFASAAAKAADGASVDFNHNIVFGGNPAAPQVTVGPRTGALGLANRLNTDPRFAAGPGLDGFRLAGNSPALDSAASVLPPLSTDVFLAPRPRGIRADVGAVESY